MNPTRPVMYLFVNKGLGMSSGKLASQAAHAAVEAYIISDKKLAEEWRSALQYPKYVMEARDEQHLSTIGRYLLERGINSKLIIDEGLTEIKSHQATALGVELVDKNDPTILAVFRDFKLFHDVVKVTLEIPR